MKQAIVKRLRSYSGVCRTVQGIKLAFDGIVAIDAVGMAEKRRLLQELRDLEWEKNVVEQALSTLDPVQRRIVQMLDIEPRKGNCERLCEMLGREQATIYRWRDKALGRVGQVLFP